MDVKSSMRCFFICLPYFLNLLRIDVNVAWLEAMTNIYYFLTFFLGVNADFKNFDAAFSLLVLFVGFLDLILFMKFSTRANLLSSFIMGVSAFRFLGVLDFFNFINALAAFLFVAILLFHYKLILSRLSFSSNSLRSPGDSIFSPVARARISGPVKCIASILKSLNASIVTGTRGWMSS